MALLLFCVYVCIYLQANEVEIVPGYGYSTRYDQIEQQQCYQIVEKSADCIFTPQTLATSSALGSHKNIALDKNILDALFRKYMLLHSKVCMFTRILLLGFVQLFNMKGQLALFW